MGDNNNNVFKYVYGIEKKGTNIKKCVEKMKYVNLFFPHASFTQLPARGENGCRRKSI